MCEVVPSAFLLAGGSLQEPALYRTLNAFAWSPWLLFHGCPAVQPWPVLVEVASAHSLY